MDKKQKSTNKSHQKKDNKCIQYSVTVASNHEKIGGHPGRITKIQPFKSKYNWKGKNYSSQKDDWKKFQENNLKTALNIFYAKNGKIYPPYVSQQNSKCGNKLFF